jgi:hypothetical protein
MQTVMSTEQVKLQRAWLRQLLIEHQQICWLHRLNLRPPVFEITEDGSKAGSWSAGFASLKMAGWLIRNHGWDVVLEVLKHEMSHQYVHEVLGRGNEKPHGPAFQEACQKLGVHPQFCRATGSIPHCVAAKEHSQPQAILTRVEKLLSLAQSANEHEAALAMEKANALLRKHNISRAEQGMIAGYDYRIINAGKKRITAVQRTIAALLKDFFYVKVVIGRQFDAASGQTARVIELIGAKENLAVAEHVYFFLVKRLDVLWRRYRKASLAPAREKRSYHLGILKGFQGRLRGQEREAVADVQAVKTNALICSDDQALVSYYHRRHPRLTKVTLRGARVFSGSYHAGEKEGQNLIIHKAVEFRGESCCALLPSL